MQRILDNTRLGSAAIKTLFLFIFMALPFFPGGNAFFLAADALLHDHFTRFRNNFFQGRQPVSRQVVLVGIDDRTNRDIGAYGKGVWTARLPFVRQLNAFRAQGPRVVAYDITFMDPLGEDDRGDSDFLRDKKLAGAIDNVLAAFERGEDMQALEGLKHLSLVGNLIGDQAMALKLSLLSETTPVILAYHMPLKEENQTRLWSMADILGDNPDELSEANGRAIPYLLATGIPLEYARNLPADFPFGEFQAKLPNRDMLDFATLGHINVPRDADGVVRRVPLVLGIGYSYPHPRTGITVSRRFLAPSMALQACLHAWGVKTGVDFSATPGQTGAPPVEVRFGDRIVIRRPDGVVTEIPIDRQGCLRLDFVGAIPDYQNVSFAVADTAEAKEHIKDKIVFVGVCATGAGDIGPVPVDDNAALVLTHMTAVSNILENSFIREVSNGGACLALAGLWLILTAVGFRAQLKTFAVFSLFLLLAWIGAVYAGIHGHRVFLPVSLPSAFLLSAYLGHLLVHYFAEEKEKMRVRGMFQTMVSTDVLQYMEDHPGSFSLAGEQRQATMFFSDVAGFTTISESLTPEKLVQLLNAYLTPMTEIILGHQGYVDKYEGDAIMAEWGVPYPNPEHAKLACFAAIEQQEKLAEMREDLCQRFGHRLFVRMGINSGTVSAGNMGSTRRFSYTVMGDAVNQAARFEPANKDYGTSIMIGPSTYELAREHIEARLLDRLVVKGKTEPAEIYELLGKRGSISQEKAAVAAKYEEALRLHWTRDFAGALALLDEVLRLDPQDGPSLNLRRRLLDYLENPPGPEWRGEFVRAGKD